MLDKTFDPAAIEAKWYAHWEATGAFRPDRAHAEPFTIIIPPPNVTGTLHIGHALNDTLQDILVRHARLQGKDALWVVGTDHAGIATQMVVERQLAADGVKRIDMGRDAFVERVWAWKAESGGAITRQLRRLGASCDWSNERFTMDPGFSKAVTKVFVDLYNQGLIYRDKRLVNWDPKFRTAISDLEVDTREAQGHFWHLRYPLAVGSGHIVVATTRPETMLGDTAVAVHPDDPRYAAIVGQPVAHPLTGRRIPVIADDWADPELGSGAVKITPAHDFNDWQVYERHREIGWINILDADARIVAADGVPAAYVGLTTAEARTAIVADLDALGLIDRVEAKTIQLPYGDRSGVVIEPWLTDQWYVDAAKLAGPAVDAVRSHQTRFVPASWDKTYFNWMENIQPWCISRQLWWGHRIPAWYGPKRAGDEGFYLPQGSKVGDDNYHCFAAVDEDDLATQAQCYYGGQNWRIHVVDSDIRDADQMILSLPARTAPIWRDPDVLDTWFSSALWPFATLGWPEASTQAAHPELVEGPGLSAAHASTSAAAAASGTDLARHYPGTVLVTAFDIIFFWVARMMMMGTHVMADVPFRTVYCHGLVRDAAGQKMSKSKGNTVDPLELIDRYGADALRFTLAAMESQGRDIKLSEERVKGYRNFATKLWNAVRFAQSQGIGASTTLEPPRAALAVNRWIVAETVRTIQAMDLALADLRFDQACDTVYAFTWSRFCDWYLELIKPVMADGGEAAEETRAVAGWVIDQILVMLHPFMPFITEELWHAQGDRGDLILAAWPRADARALDPAAEAYTDWLIRLISAIRSARTEMNVPAGANMALHVEPGVTDAHHAQLLGSLRELSRLARVNLLSVGHIPPNALQLVVDGVTYALPVGDVIDLAAERARLEKAAAAAEKDTATLAHRLANPGFTGKASPQAVEDARAKLAASTAEAARLRAALARLG